MSMDLTGITNKNEYYTNHYFSTVFEENASGTISGWNAAAKASEELHTPWSMLRQSARQFYSAHDRYVRSSLNQQTLNSIRAQADLYLKALGYPEARPALIAVDDKLTVPVYLEITKTNGAPLLWVILSASREDDAGIMESFCYDASSIDEDATGSVGKGILSEMPNEDLATKILFGAAEPPRFLILISMNQIALIDRNKWNEKRYLQFELEEIFSRLENTTLQAMSVLLHKDSLCPEDGKVLLDELDEQSQKNASGVSQDLKYALRESIELLGNEVLYDMATRLGRDLDANPVDAGQLTLECLRYMYRMLFVLFIESRPELGYAPIRAQSYYTGYSLESLRDIADNIRDDVSEVGNGYYLHETLAKLYDLIYNGYPKTEEELKEVAGSESLHDVFLIAPLKAHIFDPEYTKMISSAKLRNSCMLRIIDLMSLTRSTGKRNSRRGRISYANLGINQMGAVYEALLSYRGFIAEHDLYEVKRAGDSFNELDVGYFVPESDLDQYTEDERVRYESGEKKGKLRMYEKGTFIYRLAGREREKSASYYTPEVLTKCLVKYALKDLLEGKTADEILELTICEPAMGSAAFLNEAINQLAEAYISRKEQETGEIISYDRRFYELQKVKMFIADRNVYGIDLNPVAVELAEVSLWLNTIYEGGFVPWFGTQLVNGNSLIGARRQVYSESALSATSKGLRWYENAPDRVPVGTSRKKRRGNAQIYHFLLGDPGMCNYTDKVIKSLEPKNIKLMKEWNKKFTAPYSDDEIATLRRLSETVDRLWEDQVQLRRSVEDATRDNLSVFGHKDTEAGSHTSIREKDRILSTIYRSEHMKNAGPYARLKFAMDYWCALWFWPIDKAELLPSRSEFLFDLSLILEGTMASVVGVSKQLASGQLVMEGFARDEVDQLFIDIAKTYGFTNESVVDIPALCTNSERLNLAAQIAEQNRFMHWELEFADLFDKRGGFDLIIGNPPWIKIEWNEQGVLSDEMPLLAIRDMSAAQTTSIRNRVLNCAESLRNKYLEEFSMMTGQQSFLSAPENYYSLVGTKNNLYKCFLPQAWLYGTVNGISAFVHPNSIFDDSNGGVFRRELYPHIKRHYRFENEFKLFQDVGNAMKFSLNVYGNKLTNTFEAIFNLFDPKSIDLCYEPEVGLETGVEGIKDSSGNWSVQGHRDRIIRIDRNVLCLFASLIDGNDNWKEARMPTIHARQILEVLQCFSNQKEMIDDIAGHMFVADMWNETTAQQDGFIRRNVHFPNGNLDTIYSGPHIGGANPLFQTAQRDCKTHRAFDSVDLMSINEKYIQRMNYSIECDLSTYLDRLSNTKWGNKYNQNYRVISRKMLNLSGERSLISCIAPPDSMHTNGILGLACKELDDVVLIAGLFASVPYDFFVKTMGRQNLYEDNAGKLPVPRTSFDKAIRIRTLALNCLNNNYSNLWHQVWDKEFCNNKWASNDSRLNAEFYQQLSSEWQRAYSLRSDYERRQALIELDVLVAMSLGMTLNQLKTIYRIQFPVMQQYEVETWFDANGRIVFTNNRSLTGVGFERKEWENGVKGALAGKKFYRTIMDDTMPGGPIERTIEYVAPFDRCDREQDYETAWKFFEEKYGGRHG